MCVNSDLRRSRYEFSILDFPFRAAFRAKIEWHEYAFRAKQPKENIKTHLRPIKQLKRVEIHPWQHCFNFFPLFYNFLKILKQ